MKKVLSLLLLFSFFLVALISCENDESKETGSALKQITDNTGSLKGTSNTTNTDNSEANDEPTEEGVYTETNEDNVTFEYYSEDEGEIILRDVTLPVGCKNVTIPDGVTCIGDFAFQGCSSLTSVTIPSSVTRIRSYAFDRCSSLTSIIIPEGVTSIGVYAFEDCRGLKSVTIPSSITSIGYHAFGNCPIEEVYISDIESWCNIDFEKFFSNPLNDAKKLYLNGEPVTELVIPDGVTSIGDFAFCMFDGLVNVTLPNSLTSIGGFVFWGCSNLTDITIPNSVTKIEVETFGNCKGLTDINFRGTKEEWTAIDKGDYWNKDTGEYIIHCRDGDIAKADDR